MALRIKLPARQLDSLSHLHRLRQTSPGFPLAHRGQRPFLDTGPELELRPLQHTILTASSRVPYGYRSISGEQKARDLNQQGIDEALSDFDSAVAQEHKIQDRTPWHRQGAEEPPVRRQRSAGAMTKGRYSPVPSFHGVDEVDPSLQENY